MLMLPIYRGVEEEVASEVAAAAMIEALGATVVAGENIVTVILVIYINQMTSTATWGERKIHYNGIVVVSDVLPQVVFCVGATRRSVGS